MVLKCSIQYKLFILLYFMQHFLGTYNDSIFFLVIAYFFGPQKLMPDHQW